MAIKGSCLCGAVRYEINGSLKGAGNCHCSMCRKAHGAAFATWTFVDPPQFRWTSGTEPWHEITDELPQHREWPPGRAP